MRRLETASRPRLTESSDVAADCRGVVTWPDSSTTKQPAKPSTASFHELAVSKPVPVARWLESMRRLKVIGDPLARRLLTLHRDCGTRSGVCDGVDDDFVAIGNRPGCNVKNRNCENLARGWLQKPGLVRTSISLSFVLTAPTAASSAVLERPHRFQHRPRLPAGPARPGLPRDQRGRLIAPAPVHGLRLAVPSLAAAGRGRARRGPSPAPTTRWQT